MKNLEIYTDGGARGNPGPAAYGVVIKTTNGEAIYETGKKIGTATNNEAEYQGLIAALKWLNKAQLRVKKYTFYLDSRLVVKQMQNKFKVKAKNLKPLWNQAQQLANQLESEIEYKHIYREENTAPDQLLNQALDA